MQPRQPWLRPGAVGNEPPPLGWLLMVFCIAKIWNYPEHLGQFSMGAPQSLTFPSKLFLPFTCARFSHSSSPAHCKQHVQFTMFCDMIIKSMLWQIVEHLKLQMLSLRCFACNRGIIVTFMLPPIKLAMYCNNTGRLVKNSFWVCSVL